MRFLDACWEMASAYEMRYWMVYAGAFTVAAAFGLTNLTGTIFVFAAILIGGWLAGTRIRVKP